MTTHTAFTCDRCGLQKRGLPVCGIHHDHLGMDRMPDGWVWVQYGGVSFFADQISHHYCTDCGPLIEAVFERFDNPEPEARAST